LLFKFCFDQQQLGGNRTKNPLRGQVHIFAKCCLSGGNRHLLLINDQPTRYRRWS